jgi:hypothetical protein
MVFFFRLCGNRWHNGGPWALRYYKKRVAAGSGTFETALLPLLAVATKYGDSFSECPKTVCFWQRLKLARFEKTFAGQGAY